MTMFFSPDLYPHPGVPPPLTGEGKRDPEAKWWNVIFTSADLTPGTLVRQVRTAAVAPGMALVRRRHHTASPPGEGEMRNYIDVIPLENGIQERVVAGENYLVTVISGVVLSCVNDDGVSED
jgi:hypothetical protein